MLGAISVLSTTQLIAILFDAVPSWPDPIRAASSSVSTVSVDPSDTRTSSGTKIKFKMTRLAGSFGRAVALVVVVVLQ